MLSISVPQLKRSKTSVQLIELAGGKQTNTMTFVQRENRLKFLPIIFESTDKMHPLLQDFLAVVMDTMTMHINPQYKHIIMFYWSARLSCYLQKSIAKSLSHKYSAFNGLAAKGLHFSHPHREPWAFHWARSHSLIYWCGCVCLRGW